MVRRILLCPHASMCLSVEKKWSIGKRALNMQYSKYLGDSSNVVQPVPSGPLSLTMGEMGVAGNASPLIGVYFDTRRNQFAVFEDTFVRELSDPAWLGVAKWNLVGPELLERMVSAIQKVFDDGAGKSVLGVSESDLSDAIHKFYRVRECFVSGGRSEPDVYGALLDIERKGWFADWGWVEETDAVTEAAA